jgi:fatty-acyl-CoA synthase
MPIPHRADDAAVPEILTAPRHRRGYPAWSRHERCCGSEPDPDRRVADDLCAILYTSGTTGRPKGCMHTHGSVMFTAVGGAIWEGVTADAVALNTAPLFHVTGMQHSMNAPILWAPRSSVCRAGIPRRPAT